MRKFKKIVTMLSIILCVGIVSVGCNLKPVPVQVDTAETDSNTSAPTEETPSTTETPSTSPEVDTEDVVTTSRLMTDEEFKTYLESTQWTFDTKDTTGADKYFTALALRNMLYADENYYVPTVDNATAKVRTITEVSVVDNIYYVNINLLGTIPFSQLHTYQIEEKLIENLNDFTYSCNFMVYYNDKVICNYNTL